MRRSQRCTARSTITLTAFTTSGAADCYSNGIGLVVPNSRDRGICGCVAATWTPKGIESAAGGSAVSLAIAGDKTDPCYVRAGNCIAALAADSNIYYVTTVAARGIGRSIEPGRGIILEQ
jgi:hypothetical protein